MADISSSISGVFGLTNQATITPSGDLLPGNNTCAVSNTVVLRSY